jgi:hypothetical protein
MMKNITIPEINEKLKSLSERDLHDSLPDSEPQTIGCMHASEQVLSQDWNLSEEDEAWGNL